MAALELATQLAAQGVTLESLMVSSSSVEVHYGRYKQQKAAVKLIYFPPNSDHTVLERECNVLFSLQHPSIIKVYSSFWVNDARGNWYLVLAMELQAGDLGRAIAGRLYQPWTEGELWTILRKLVDALAFMQEKGYAHRDIKPENIFISPSNEVVLGDFGSARQTLDPLILATLAGTPLFLSPLLRKCMVGGEIQVQHNLFKSDVYSLGVTLLFMCLRTQPLFIIMQTVRPQSTPIEILGLQYSDALKQIICWMLMEDEDLRCDFLQLRNYLNTLFPQVAPTPPPPRPEDFQRKLEVVACLGCKQTLQRSTLGDKDIVQLMCDPTNHIFCSKICCQSFCEANGGENLKCPECKEPLSVSPPTDSKASLCALF